MHIEKFENVNCTNAKSTITEETSANLCLINQ